MYVGKHQVGIIIKNGREYIQIRNVLPLFVQLLPHWCVWRLWFQLVELFFWGVCFCLCYTVCEGKFPCMIFRYVCVVAACIVGVLYYNIMCIFVGLWFTFLARHWCDAENTIEVSHCTTHNLQYTKHMAAEQPKHNIILHHMYCLPSFFYNSYPTITSIVHNTLSQNVRELFFLISMPVLCIFFIILYCDQQLHNYFTNYHTPTCFETIVSSSGRL